jgi:hypothetical protein
MKKALVLVAILLLASSLAWAEGTPEAAAPQAVGQAAPGAAEGSCTLPDFAGLSPDQRLAAALAAGFQMDGAVNRQVPICPTEFRCSSLTNCGAGSPCSTTDIGQCCDAGGGAILCCASGTIKVRQCPCVCTTSPCLAQCAASTDVTFHCR